MSSDYIYSHCGPTAMITFIRAGFTYVPTELFKVDPAPKDVPTCFDQTSHSRLQGDCII